VDDDCTICLKYEGRGPLTGLLIARAAGFLIYHAMTDEEGRSPLGYLFIESERHTPYLWDLSDEVLPKAGPDEVAAFAKRLRNRLELQPS
jgi:hypothetical protein